MKQRLILSSASVLALAAALVPGCGDHVADSVTSPPLTPGAGGSSSTPAGAAGAGNQVAASGGTAATGAATPGTGGTEGTPAVQPPGSAGSTGTNVNNGAAQGGSGGAAGASAAAGAPGAAGAPPVSTPGVFCAGSPSDGVMCMATCTDECGIHNLGTRLCTCTNALYDCATCAFAMPHPLLTPPTTPLVACPLSDDAQEDDESGCTENERCQSIGRTPGATDGANRFCGCLLNEWDCDTKPAGF